MRRILLLTVLLMLSPRPLQAEDEPLGLAPPTTWLVIDEIDQRGRRPFREDQLFRRYLRHRGVKVRPRAGEVVRGGQGEAAWREVEADPDGRVDCGRVALAYARFETGEATTILVRCRGGTTLMIDGTFRGGDVYGHGTQMVPVRLSPGPHEIYVDGIRNGFTVGFEPPPASLFVSSVDATLADVVRDEASPAHAGILVVNAEERAVSGWTLEATLRMGERTVTTYAEPEPLPPLGLTKVPVVFDESLKAPADLEAATLEVTVRTPAGDASTTTFDLEVRDTDEVHLRSFVSGIDGSVQHFAVRRPQGELPEGASMGLVLTLHGAGVRARRQALAYAPKPDFWIVAPTNRRRFGFDWQDWGRIDAYEVLSHALALSGVSRDHVHLTGHSMGGHGTWHLGANDPDGFASLAPSAGWISFDTYGGRPVGLATRVWHAADGPSRTLELLENLRQVPVYILHGTEDDNVPASEARRMQRALEAAEGSVQAHYEEGAGHWWDGDDAPGARCVDWPGFFEMFRASRIPSQPDHTVFVSEDLGTDHEHHGLRILQPLQYGEPCRVEMRRAEGGALLLDTRNVRFLTLDASPTTIRIDGERVEPSRAYERTEGSWGPAPASPPFTEKHPLRMGPFKRAFDHRFVLVYGTAGSEADTEAALARARLDQDRWRYRANGYAPCVSDASFLSEPERYVGRNVILYGSERSNGAWQAVLGDDAAVTVRPGRLQIGRKALRTDQACLLVVPRKDDPTSLVGVVAALDPAALRLTSIVPYFGSGVGLPDYTVFGQEVLRRGDQGVSVTGFFDRTWQPVEEGD